MKLCVPEVSDANIILVGKPESKGPRVYLFIYLFVV
jgi:hypothetical protein